MRTKKEPLSSERLNETACGKYHALVQREIMHLSQLHDFFGYGMYARLLQQSLDNVLNCSLYKSHRSETTQWRRNKGCLKLDAIDKTIENCGETFARQAIEMYPAPSARERSVQQIYRASNSAS